MPVQTPSVSAWDESRTTLLPAAVFVRDGAFYLYYRANDTVLTSTGFELGLAVAPSGYGPFVKYPNNPVLEVGSAGAWDDDAISRASILSEGGQFVMFYQGREITPSVVNRIGYATSPNLLDWTKYGSNPILSPTGSGWESGYVLSPSVLRKQNDPLQDLLMFYQGFGTSNQNGVATGTSYTSWSRYGSNPNVPLGSAGAWDDHTLARPTVVYLNGTYHYWYYARGSEPVANSIGYGTSSDGLVVTKHAGNPVFTVGASGQWDDADVADPYVVYHDGLFWMYYAGAGTLGGEFSVGLATSTDGINWTRF